MQRTVGNSQVQRMMARRIDGANGHRLNSVELRRPLSPASLRISRQSKGSMKPSEPSAKPDAKSSGVTVDEIKELPDQTGATKPGRDGETTITTPYEWSFEPDKDSKMGSFSIEVSREIQTTYRKGVDPAKGKSGFGRGTTDEDKKAGNTSLSFHESCHKEDFKRYFHENPLPGFTDKKKMTKKEFMKAKKKYDEELEKYREKAARFSEQQTDCVGMSYDEYQKAHGGSGAPKCTP